MPKTVVGFDLGTAEKLLQKIRQERPDSPPKPSRPPLYVRESDAGIVTTEITARSGNTVGTGVVDSISRENDDGTDFQYPVVQNVFSQAVEVDTYVVITRLIGGTWVVVAADC